MVQPMNYNIDVQSPFEAALSGFKIGATVADIQAQRQAQEAQMRAQEAELQRRQMLNSQIASLMQNPNPTARDFANIAMQLPEKEAASMRANWDALSKDKQDNELRFGGQVMSAFGSSQPQIGIQLLRERATAERNSGNEQQAKAYETWAQMAEASPQTAQKTIGIMLAGLPGGDKVIEGTVKIATEERAAAMAPAQLSEAEAKAKSAAVAAKFAESNAAIDLQKKGWDINKIQNDILIAKQNASIAAMNAQIAREGNDLKRTELQLKLQEMEQKRDESVRGKVAEATTAAAQSDNLLNTVEKALNMSITGRDKYGKPTGFTGTIESATGPISSRIPTLSQDVADFEEIVETLGSQITMSRIGEMKGALSDKDLATLKSSLQSLSLRQSPEQLVGNLIEIQRLTQKARKNTMDKFGAPAALSVPDTPSAQPSPAEIGDLLKRYGGGR
jgi:hypothetical protein